MGLYLNSPKQTDSLYEALLHKIKLNIYFLSHSQSKKKKNRSCVNFDDILRLVIEFLVGTEWKHPAQGHTVCNLTQF